MPTGYVFVSDDPEGHRNLVDEVGRFTDIRPSRPRLAERQIAVVSFEGRHVDAIALMIRGARKAASYKWLVTLEDFVTIDPPLPLGQFSRRLPKRLAAGLRQASKGRGAQFEGPSWDSLRRALIGARPYLEDELTRLQARASARRPLLGRGGREPIVAYERDAVGLSLALAGIDRRPVLSSWTGSEDAPFLTGIRQFRVPEDRMIEHDARVFGGWELLRQGAVGMVEFADRDRRLTVINVNRAGVEHALGVDLVYYNHDFDAYVLVQYKRMLPRSAERGYEFRPDDQTRRELERLRRTLASSGSPSAPRHYRLDPKGAFLKLCPATTTEAFTDELIKGMYLPLEYWDVLVDSPEVRGPRGGVAITYENVDRHINNTTFIELVGSGWIGSRYASTDQITTVIRQALDSRSLVLAEASSALSIVVDRPSRRGRAPMP